MGLGIPAPDWLPAALEGLADYPNYRYRCWAMNELATDAENVQNAARDSRRLELSRLGPAGEIDRVDRVGAERLESPARAFDLLDALMGGGTEV